MKLIVTCNNVPDTVNKMLTELGETSITYLENNAKVPSKLKTEMLFIPSYSDFKSNLKVLNSETYEKKVVFLFCPVIKARSLNTTYFLDVDKEKKVGSMTSTYRNLSLDRLSAYLGKDFKKKKIKESEVEYKYVLIESVRAGSLLNPLMTLLYSVKAEGGLKIKEIVLSWLVSTDKIETLKKKLKNSYDWGEVSSKFCERLLTLLESDLGQRYKKALSEIEVVKNSGEKPNTISIAKKHQIDDYELRYICSALIKTKDHPYDGKTVEQVYKAVKAKKHLADAAA